MDGLKKEKRLKKVRPKKKNSQIYKLRHKIYYHIILEW